MDFISDSPIGVTTTNKYGGSSSQRVIAHSRLYSNWDNCILLNTFLFLKKDSE